MVNGLRFIIINCYLHFWLVLVIFNNSFILISFFFLFSFYYRMCVSTAIGWTNQSGSSAGWRSQGSCTWYSLVSTQWQCHRIWIRGLCSKGKCACGKSSLTNEVISSIPIPKRFGKFPTAVWFEQLQSQLSTYCTISDVLVLWSGIRLHWMSCWQPALIIKRSFGMWALVRR